MSPLLRVTPAFPLLPLRPADRAGASNAALPRDEDRESFAAIAAACAGRADAEDLLAEIINAA